MVKFDRKEFDHKMQGFVRYEDDFFKTHREEYNKVYWEAQELIQSSFPKVGCRLAISNPTTPYTEVIVTEYYPNNAYETIAELQEKCYPIINVRPFYKNGNINHNSTPDLAGQLDLRIVNWITDEYGCENKKPIPGLPYLIVPDNLANLAVNHELPLSENMSL